jgi:soluble lytic murein transglycosylase-like protein
LFARVIWQESRFDAQAVSPKGAASISQFMPATASWYGLADAFAFQRGEHEACEPGENC